MAIVLPQIANEVLGENILRQIELVVPDFFDNDYVIFQLKPKPEHEQGPGYPHRTDLEPIVVYSTIEEFTQGQKVDPLQDFKQISRTGCSITISPRNIRNPRFPMPEEDLEKCPCDYLVIAEINPLNN